MRNIRSLLHLNETKGDVGLEIEVEGTNLPLHVEGFTRVHDGSLRGPETGEYIFASPCNLRETKKRLKNLLTEYENHATIIDTSYRTSTHVHINMQEDDMVTVYNMIILYLIFEDYLVKYCGEDREGNLFCLRMRDAEALLPMLLRAASSRSWSALSNEWLRYAAINVCALSKFGSLEFRSMRGTDDLDAIYV